VQTDVFGTYVLLEAVKKNKISRYLQISTDEVYGSIEHGAFTEENTLSPNSPYSASKAGGDLLVRAYFKTFKLPVIITRSSNNYGPFQYPEKIIPFFVTNALSGQKLPLYGDGKNVRDWLYVKDNCEALDIVVHRGKEGEIYNIGGVNEEENITIAKTILLELKLPESMIEYVKDRPGHDRRYALSIAKIKKEFGWEPKRNFKSAMSETIVWYKENTQWWKEIKEKQKEFNEFHSAWYKR
jgi:dTDP-glucose 4,6-dehydratase